MIITGEQQEIRRSTGSLSCR